MNLQKGLIGHWTMDDSDTSNGNLYDRSARNNHGETRSGITSGVSGRVGEAFSFDGTNGAYVPTQLFYDSTGITAVSVAHWFKSSSSADQITVSSDRNEYWRLGVGSDGVDGVLWAVDSSDMVSSASRSELHDGNWHHIVGTFNGSLTNDHAIYIDGQLDSKASLRNSFGSGNKSYTHIGVGSEASVFDGSQGPDDHVVGEMDDVRVYNREISASESLALYNMRSQINQNLVKNVSFYDVSDLYSNSGHPGSKSGLDNFFDDSRSDVSHILTRKHDRSTVNHGLEGQSTSEFGSVNSEPYYFTRSDSYAWKIEGEWTAPETGVYEFGIDSDDASDVLIDNNPVATFYGGHGFDGSVSNHSGTVSLIKGERYKVSFRYEEGGGGSGLTVGYKKPSDSSYVLFPAENIF